jgi:hypothetical protein
MGLAACRKHGISFSKMSCGPLKEGKKPLLEAPPAPEVPKKQGFLSQGHKKARKNATKLCRRL